MVKRDAPLTTAPYTEGTTACSPEDVGGAPGCGKFLVALGDSKHSEHRELQKWIGQKLDPTAFNVEGVNAQLNSRPR